MVVTESAVIPSLFDPMALPTAKSLLAAEHFFKIPFSFAADGFCRVTVRKFQLNLVPNLEAVCNLRNSKR